jgi:hypothetical protein
MKIAVRVPHERMNVNPERPIIWSYGGGTQSVAIAVLVATGELPRPERVVIADTGRERTSTWDYTNTFVNPLLAKVGLEVEVAPHSLAKVDLVAKNGDLLMPMFTKAKNAKLPTFCSTEWKKAPIFRWMRAQGYGPKNPVRVWMGISVDEVHRAKPSGTKWAEYWWPLLFDTPRRRDECKALVMAAGLPIPPKSACWMCPHHQNEGWRDLRDNWPADWLKAIELDSFLRKIHPDNDVYLHKSRLPLGEADIDDEHENLDLFGECDSGFCFV